MRFAIIAALLVLAIAVLPTQAITITKGVVIDPTGSLAKYVFDCIYDVDGATLVVEEEWFALDGLKLYCDPTVELTVIIHKCEPNNRNAAGKPVVEFSTIAHQKGSFVIELGGLVPNADYVIYKNGEEWKTVSTDDEGTLKFHDSVGSENKYIVVKLAGAAPVLPPPPEEYEFPWWLLALALLIVIAGVLYWRRR